MSKLKLERQKKNTIIRLKFFLKKGSIEAYNKLKEEFLEIEQQLECLNLEEERKTMESCNHVFAIYSQTEDYKPIVQCLKCSMDNTPYMDKDHPNKTFTKREQMMIDIWSKLKGPIEEVCCEYINPNTLKIIYNKIITKNPNASIEDIKAGMIKGIKLEDEKNIMNICDHLFVVYDKSKHGLFYRQCVKCSLNNSLYVDRIEKTEDLSKYNERDEMMAEICGNEQNRKGRTLLVLDQGNPKELTALYKKIKIDNPRISFEGIQNEMRSYFKKGKTKELKKKD